MSVHNLLLQMLGALGSGAFGALFLFTGIGKATDSARFASDIAAYRLLPLDAAFPAAYAIIVTEALLGIWLFSGAATLAAGLVSAVLLLVFAAAMGINVARGRTHLSCGCIPGVDARLSWASVLRNVALAVLVFLVGLCGQPEFGLLCVEGLLMGVSLLLLCVATASLTGAEALS
ncbi:MauE/DoxX family redox-associated membrane protein [Acetobacter cerevisiae]|uniref:MauE/DoxX family redox-associated membrane protein n=1 Tax=Acetobacter cerevisiae TaxID=178900 RepID=UPI0020A0AD9B|nr:MauE/DoxX family redox-associated membrane protein [Acetobacter cerevisiae]MCP1270323.1 methylamine utilization protein MauE [Acetobacter cerevisiae]MCP1278276.1 methylamine utilization protein MauE [Acetobacter cerevisiae]